MAECHYCGRPMPRDNTVSSLPWPVCNRTCCEDNREVLTTQHLKLGWYWRPVKSRFMERRNLAENNSAAAENVSGGSDE